MLISYKNGQGSVVLRVLIRDSSVSTGAGLTGLTSASSGLKIATIADNEATTTVYTVAASNVETIATLGTYAAPTASKCRFKEVDSTNHPGVYEIQIADARFAVSNAKSLLVSITGATNAAPCHALVPLQSMDPYDAVRAGLTSLPNAAAEASGGLITRGTGTGQLSVSSGRALADVDTIKTQTVTCAAGVTVLASVGTAATSTAQTGDSYARIGANGAGLTALGDTRIAYLDAAVTSRLAPTTAGRTLDVSATGEAGIDWANVGSPTTTVALSGTTVGVVTTLTGHTAQTGDAYARIGAAGVGLTAVGLADKTGMILASGGLDSISIESGINARQALSPILAACAGSLSGAGTGTIVIKAGGVDTTRITATTDSSGNRSSVSLSLPA